MRRAVISRLGLRDTTFEQPLPAWRAGTAASGHNEMGRCSRADGTSSLSRQSEERGRRPPIWGASPARLQRTRGAAGGQIGSSRQPWRAK
jgi:hypothetical protein